MAFHRLVLLPTQNDIVKLKDFLEEEVKSAYDDLRKDQQSSECFQRLQAAVLCRLITFNKRRSGETSKILLTDYVNRPVWQENLNEEIYNSLGTLEKQLVNRLDMIIIRGKRGRTVSVILTQDVRRALDLLVNCRKHIICADNPYLFPRLSGKNYLRGNEHLKKFADKAGLQYPERFGSTNMRRYIATVVQMLNLNDGELEWLSNHLGHTIQVHKEFYRNQSAAIQFGKVAKTLIAMDQGRTLQQLENEDVPSNDSHKRPDIPRNKKNGSRKQKAKTPWTNNEIQSVKRHLQGYINTQKVPGKKACLAAKENEPALVNRDWKAIKYYIYNQIEKRNKKK